MNVKNQLLPLLCGNIVLQLTVEETRDLELAEPNRLDLTGSGSYLDVQKRFFDACVTVEECGGKEERDGVRELELSSSEGEGDGRRARVGGDFGDRVKEVGEEL